VSPEQITEQLDEIISNIADAHILIHRLKQGMGVGKRYDIGSAGRKATDVIYEDIWADMRLSEAHTVLRKMESDLARWSDTYLPEHFDRLRAEVKP
jgi:hypothetical protein